MNNAVFGKITSKCKKTQRYQICSHIWSKKKWFRIRNNYHKTDFFSEDLLTIEMKKTLIFVYKPVYWGLSILEISQIVNLFDYSNPKYGEKVKLCYTGTHRFIVDIKTIDIYKYIAEDIETKFGTSNYELNTPLQKRKNKKVIGAVKNELAQKIMK